MRPYRAFGLFSLATLCASAALSAQSPAAQTPVSPAATASAASSKFAAEPFVIERSDDVNTMRADGTGERLRTYVVSLQSEAAVRDFSVLSIYISSESETGDFTYVRVVHSDGTKQETPVSSSIQQPAPVTQQAPWYSDLQIKQIPVRSMRVGDRLEWQARFVQAKALVPGQFWDQSEFNRKGVCLDENIELHVPAGLHLTVWSNPRSHGVLTESERDGQHIYHWHSSNLKPTVGPEAEAEKKKEEKRLRTADEELDDTKGELPALGWTTFSDWAAVGAWYRGLLTDRITPDDAIKAKVAELTAGKATDLEKAQAIYNYVSTRIRYIGVNFGIGKLQPHPAAEVFANQFGDCKDKHVLLASMLSVIGIQAEPVLIGSGVRFNRALPAPLSFNHLITLASIGGKPVWLDATAESGIWAALLKPLRDHEALVIPASGPAIVQETPADLPFPQSSTFQVAGSLDNDLTSSSSVTLSMHGDDELVFRSLLRQISPANYGEFVQRWMATMGFGGTTSEPAFENLDDPGKPLTITFHYRRVKEKGWGENRITATFLLIGLPYYRAENPPVESIQLGSPRIEDSTVEMELPKGWNATPPEAIHAHTAFATCDVTFNTKNGKLIAERKLAVLASSVKVADAKKYQTWYEDCGASSVPYIELSPGAKVSKVAIAPLDLHSLPPAGTAKVHSDPEAAKLVQDAYASIRSDDLDSARQSLDKAEAINPTELWLWSGYAEISRQLGQLTKLVENAKRELAYHPEDVQLYAPLAQVQFRMGDKEAALATMRDWVKAAPDSGDAPLALVQMLMGQKKNEEAFRTAQDALGRIDAKNPKRLDLQIEGALARAESGSAPEAARDVAPLLEAATTPELINEVTYVLALANVKLEDAAAAQARAIALVESDSAQRKADDLLPAIHDTQMMLPAMWDTMAWILYRQGKLEDALAYADAARHGSDEPAVREHFTAIATALRKPSAIASARQGDQGLRTFHLGSSHGQTGVLPVQLLLEDGKIAETVPSKSPTSGSPSLRNGEQFVKDLDLHQLFPPGSKARMLREGVVNCHQGACELVLAPL